MSERISEEMALLAARVSDLYRRAERYEIAVGPFLTPAEQFALCHRIGLPDSEAFSIFYGGYDGSERNRILVLPEYYAREDGLYDAAFVRENLPDAFSAISVLRIRGSGYKSLSHRDYLGSLLALGVQRDKLGDIVVLDEFHALVFCDGVLSDFVISELCRIGKDTVKVERVELGADFKAERRFAPISDTIASVRLDCIVAALIHCSREKAQDAIGAGLVEMNYEVQTRNDKLPPEGAIISVRGYGKYRLRDMTSQTKKGRFRLLADQYI